MGEVLSLKRCKVVLTVCVEEQELAGATPCHCILMGQKQHERVANHSESNDLILLVGYNSLSEDRAYSGYDFLLFFDRFDTTRSSKHQWQAMSIGDLEKI